MTWSGSRRTQMRQNFPWQRLWCASTYKPQIVDKITETPGRHSPVQNTVKIRLYRCLNYSVQASNATNIKMWNWNDIIHDRMQNNNNQNNNNQKWMDDHHGNRCAESLVTLATLLLLHNRVHTVGIGRSWRVSQHLQQCEDMSVLYLFGLSLRLVLRARNELCSWPSSNGSKALERKPWERDKKRLLATPTICYKATALLCVL